MLEKYMKQQPLFCNQIKRIIQNNKIAHAYLIETNGVSYGFDLAIALSKSFLCEKKNIEKLNCDKCQICHNIDEGNYPDLKIIDTDSKMIKKEQMLEIQELFSIKPLYGQYMIYIINNANLLNDSAANTILKFLEEPSSNIIAILLTDNIYNCIETIVSRCQILTLINNEDNPSKNIFKKYNEEDLEDYIETETKNIIDYYLSLEQEKTKFLSTDFVYNYKEKLDLLFSVGLDIYMNVLNYKFNNVEVEKKYIKEILEKNTINDIIKKIDIINQFLENSKFNVNKELFIDNFVITFSGGVYEN